jgi:hypothetical protein
MEQTNTPNNTVGRPTKYEPRYCEEIIQEMSKGMSKEGFAGKISISKQTLYSWMDKHSEFMDAVKVGEMKSLLFWESIGRSAIFGQITNFNTTCFMFHVKNRFGWKEREDVPIVEKFNAMFQ